MAKAATHILPDSKEKEDDEELRLKYIRPFESSYYRAQCSRGLPGSDQVGRMLDMVSKNIDDAFSILISVTMRKKEKDCPAGRVY